MPIKKYDKNFGGKPGAAQKAKDAMAQQYGAKKGEQVFYATKNKNAGKGDSAPEMPPKKKHRRKRGIAHHLSKK